MNAPPLTTPPLPPRSGWTPAALRPAPDAPRRPPPARERPGVLHLVLFMATLVTTTVAGVGLTHRPSPLPIHVALALLRVEPARILDGIGFSAPLLCMLFAHEMGHYGVARLWNVRTSWPYFVPLPVGLGTLGAMIGMDAEDERRHRRALLEIGAAGPLVGFGVAFVFVLLGLHFSPVKTSAEMERLVAMGGLTMPDSLAMGLGRWLVHGTLPPDRHLLLHPMAMAGWYGLFLTWFNLLPFGTLDGGHITHALWPRGGRQRSLLVVLLVVLGALVSGLWSWLGMLVGLFILGALGGLSGGPLPPGGPPAARQQAVVVACLLVFVLCFVAEPLPRAGR